MMTMRIKMMTERMIMTKMKTTTRTKLMRMMKRMRRTTSRLLNSTRRSIRSTMSTVCARKDLISSRRARRFRRYWTSWTSSESCVRIGRRRSINVSRIRSTRSMYSSATRCVVLTR